MAKITSENYVSGVLRTDSPVTPEMIARFSQPETIRLIHATLGMVTEAAELADMLKKHLFYGRPLDLVNAAEEVGDSMWYVGLAVDVLHTTMNEILTMNHEKLRLRYPEKFTEHHAENRNLTAERALLEGINPTKEKTAHQITDAIGVTESELLRECTDNPAAAAKLLNRHICNCCIAPGTVGVSCADCKHHV